MPISWYDGVVTRIEIMAPQVKRFFVEIPGDGPFEFKGGQFMTFDLPIGEKRLQRWRSYSVASGPDGGRVLEFCIVFSGRGEGTRYLFEEVRVGSVLRIKGPDGAFFLPEIIDRDLVFICTGTGIAPFRSMLNELRASGREHRNLHLIFGTRTEETVLYRSEFEEMAANWPGFRYDIALSRQEDWSGHKGYVHDIYLNAYADRRSDITFYLCGWTNMIDDAVANLMVKLGYDRKQIIYELYG